MRCPSPVPWNKPLSLSKRFPACKMEIRRPTLDQPVITFLACIMTLLTLTYPAWVPD